MDRLECNERPGTSNKAHTAREWEAAKPEIKRLYHTKSMTLSKTMVEMEKRGFSASEKLYKVQLNKWKMGKNATRNDYLAFAWIYRSKHADASKPEIYVRIHHKVCRIQDLRRYLKNHDEQEEAFFDEAIRSPVSVPPYMHVCNADGSVPTDVTLKPAASQAQQARPMSPCDVSNATDGFQATKQRPAATGSQSPPRDDWRRLQPGYTQVELTAVEEPQAVIAAGTNASSNQFDSLDAAPDFNDLSSLSSFQVVAAWDEDRIRQNIGEAPQDCTEHGTSPNRPSIDTSDQLTMSTLASDDRTAQHAYQAACMMAAMLGAAGRRDAMTECLERGSRFFQRMCQFHSPSVLTTAVIVLTWLLVHAEGSLSAKVMAASLVAATEALGPNNPVSLLLEWMTAAAGRGQVNTCRIGSRELRNVWQGFCQTLGEVHGHSIVALYCLCFQLILADKEFSEAEQYLQQLSLVSENVFGVSCVLTINILATLSRAQLRQGKYLLALETIDRSLAAAPLGLNHPHRLELLLRKALILRKLDRWEDTEKLYWIVVKGRTATLGWQHQETIAAHNSLVWVLKERTGNWDARKDDVQRLLVDPQVSVDDYESWWRRFVEANRAPTSDGQGSGDEDE